MHASREYKIAVIGSTGVGKSSICLQFARNKFPENYEPTVVDYYRKQVMIDGEQSLFDVIDTAGQEGNMISLNSLIKQAYGYLLVYDITRKESFTEAGMFRHLILNAKSCLVAPLVLVGNKLDKADSRQIPFETGLKQAVEWNCRFWEVSAKEKCNLDCAFLEVARMIKVDGLKQARVGTACCVCVVF